MPIRKNNEWNKPKNQSKWKLEAQFWLFLKVAIVLLLTSFLVKPAEFYWLDVIDKGISYGSASFEC